jgi:hypothetical protein
MKYSNTAVRNILSSAALIVLAAQASAAQEIWSGIDTEISTCVAAVADHANYSDATRVRHAVVGVKERTVGYKLTIETSVYDNASNVAIREYATSCVVNGSNVPMQFSISETDNDA